jgi:hypothetical protein
MRSWPTDLWPDYTESIIVAPRRYKDGELAESARWYAAISNSNPVSASARVSNGDENVAPASRMA